MSTRRIEGLCPACLASGVSGALADFLQTKPQEPVELAVQIEGCEIESVLGAGAMGIVYHGVRSDTNEAVAVKVLSRSISGDAEMAERFRREAVALAALDHPNIVRVVSTGMADDGRLYLAMELVDGCDLRRLLKAEKLSTDRALDIFCKVCQGIEHAHAHGMIHRDIKPANILVGINGAVKVADFGIAKAAAGSLSSFTLTQTREAFGTPYYIAPEVARQDAADERADIYALGVLLYEVITGRVPMGSVTPASQLAGVPSQFDALITQSMSDDAAKRPQTVQDMREAVERIRESQTVTAKRRRALKMSAYCAVAALSVASAAILGMWWQREAMKPPPAPVYAAPASATRERPWINSLGMTFVPVPETTVLWCMHETRRGEYAQFYQMDRATLPQWRMNTLKTKRTEYIPLITKEGWIIGKGDWREPGFPQTDAHPVVGVDLRDSRSFCVWLTWKEQQEGRLGPGMRYRLPRNEEWVFATGYKSSGEEKGPRKRRETSPEIEVALAAANFAGEEVRLQLWPTDWPIRELHDAFPRTAPCGSFPGNAHGLHDLFGNVAEWVDTLRPAASTKDSPTYSVRGGSWSMGGLSTMHPSTRIAANQNFMRSDIGFRVVLEIGEE